MRVTTHEARVLAIALELANTPARCTPKGDRRPSRIVSLQELPDEPTRQKFIEQAETAIAILEANGAMLGKPREDTR